MFAPAMFEEHLLPLYQRLMTYLDTSGQRELELVIGGDTAPIANPLKETGATILLCDFTGDDAFEMFFAKIREVYPNWIYFQPVDSPGASGQQYKFQKSNTACHEYMRIALVNIADIRSCKHFDRINPVVFPQTNHPPMQIDFDRSTQSIGNASR